MNMRFAILVKAPDGRWVWVSKRSHYGRPMYTTYVKQVKTWAKQETAERHADRQRFLCPDDTVTVVAFTEEG